MKFILIFLIFFSSFLWAEVDKQIIIATESWKGATNRDGTGLYWEIMQRVYEPLGYSIIKKHVSYSEATELVHSNNADIFLAAYKDEKSFALYPKYYFDQDIVVAIFRHETIEEWKGKESLDGLTLGWIRGYDYDKYLNVKMKIKESSNRINGLKQLKSDRIDVFIDEKEDIQVYLSKAKLSSKEFAKKTILQLKLYPAFTKSKKGKKLMKIWDERMKNLILQDDFKEIYFKSEYTIFPY
ncbi:MAG: hypothetical protein COA44_01790 [Arcobacter sp.]|nr:MAG: hypothetical protein COA44_01790 [Arcobacter sp.]